MYRRLFGGLTALAVAVTGFAEEAPETGSDDIEEVIVTGSYIKRSPADSPTPLSIISSADIENNHTVDMNELLTRIPYQSGGYIQAATFTGGGFQGRLPINLRNLGDAATLPLVNGRRHVPAFVAPLGDSTVDINSMIPQVMIDRIEIVKDGSSALYGSDAIAGVVNFITKRDFEGVDIDVRALTDEATGLGDEFSVGLLVGAQGDRGGFVMGMDFLDRNEIPTDHPDVYDFQGGFGVSGTGNPGRFPFADSSPLLWASGNPVPQAIRADGSTAKALPRVPEAMADPANPAHWGNGDYNCNDAALWDGLGGTLGLVTTSGIQNNLCAIDYGNFFSIQEGETLQKFYATGYFDISDRVELYFEGGFAEQEYYRPNSLAPQSRAPTIPITHFGLIEDANRRGIQPVPLVSVVRLQGGTRQLTGTTYRPIDSFQSRDGDTLRGVVGIDADLEFGDREWNLNASFSWSEQSMEHKRVSDTRAQELSAALNGLGGPKCNPLDPNSVPGAGNLAYAQTGNFDDGTCYYYNPFGNAHFTQNGTYVDGATSPSILANPPELIKWLEGGTNEIDEVEQRVIDVVLAGELFDLDSGPVGMAIGFQSRHDDLNKDYDVNFNQNNVAFRFGAADVVADLTSRAAFVEFIVPITDTIEIQTALRHEDFDEINTSTTDPKISGIWRPNDNWSFRASWGQSFRVGGLMQLFGTQTIVSNTRDPLLDTEFFLPWISTGSTALEPEESEAWNIGLSWSGSEGWQDGLSFNLDFWNYDYTNLLTKESAPALLIADGEDRLAGGPGNPEQVIRNTTLNPVRILPNFINANSVEVSGADFDINYTWSNDLGVWNVSMATAWTESYKANTSGGSVDGVGTLNRTTILARALPEWKTNFTLNWTRGRHSAFAMARYVDSVINDAGPSSFLAATRSLANCFIATGQVCVGEDDSYQRELDSTWWVDAYYNIQLPEMGFIPEGGVLSFGVRNLLDTEVERVNNNAGFDGIMHDARGRMYMVRYRLSIL